jgi:hypothetical protein
MTDTTASTRVGGVRTAAGLVAAAAVATALNAAVAALAHGAGASPEFQALQLPTYATFTVLGVLAGAAAALPGASWGGAVALMVMHLVVTVVAVGAYLRVLPLRS